jgi:hypothetical protein
MILLQSGRVCEKLSLDNLLEFLPDLGLYVKIDKLRLFNLLNWDHLPGFFPLLDDGMPQNGQKFLKLFALNVWRNF